MSSSRACARDTSGVRLDFWIFILLNYPPWHANPAYTSAVYHVILRGNAGDQIFFPTRTGIAFT